ncbi:PAS domain S-box protein [Hydrogenophaga sp.]|uniref:PAS domain S-box protein n=1 Tax=Hydrogenophaga sp. TaxID=1904254 RepID=UPI00272FB9F8|nr:PAS domain S-box protein [Hydrogenophaga sp.]MDP2074134.1 PAS domain S-box protein [Hydrogenophaga sp.]MDP3109838.1 PAS domain S-box protein [Hydrogenophaga sp.]
MNTTPPGEPGAQTPVNLLPAANARDPQRIWLGLLSVVAIGLFLLLAIGLLVSQRQAALDMAKAQAQREVKRLAAELEESLRMARAGMDIVLQSPEVAQGELLGDHTPLVRSLNLPFSLRQTQAATPGQAAGQWLPGLAREEAGRWVVPLTWQHPPEQGGQTFEVLLDRQALLGRFASEGMSAGGSMSLFRVEDDGATTILVRYPVVERDQGRTVRGHVTTALQQAPSGVMKVVAVIDGVPRIVGYQRMNEGAGRLVMVYALPLDGVLATWSAMLPLAIALTLLVAAAMAFGAWRLDRAMHQRHRSERHFQTLTGHLPDVVVRYDQKLRVLYANPAVEAANGLKPSEMLGRTLSEIGAPPDIAAKWNAYIEGVFRTGQSETLCFSYPGPDGQRHWEAQALLEPALPGDRPTVLAVSRDITERHEAEARRLSAQQLFESVFRSAPEAMSLTEWHTGRLVLVNDAFCELFGRSREQLIGRSTIELNLWQSPSIRHELIERLERGEVVRHAAGSSSRPDGSLIHVRYSAERVQQNGAQCLLLMFRDVTQLESEQRALERSELRFRLAAAQGQVWEWDFDGGFIQPSDAFFVSLGHPAPSTQQMGQLFLDLLHPEDLPRLRMVLQRFFKGEDNYQIEFRARDAQGRYHWFDTRGSGLREANGRVTYMAGTTFDISDRKALEEAQRQTLVQLETVANASPALIWTSGSDKRADWFNGAWLAFTGRTLKQEVDEGWLKGIHPDDQTRCMTAYFNAFEAREPFSMEHRLWHHSGGYRWLLAQGRPRFDADNRFIGFIGSCLDLTELREAEATARERGAMLEQVFDVLQDMLFVVDEHERFVHYQAGRQDMLYAPPEQFLGRVIADVMPPEPTAQLRDALARARSQGLQEIEYSLALPDGMHTFSARLAWLPESRLCMFVVRDVTERRAAQLESERLSQFVLLLFGLANRFINLPVHQADAAIREALGDIGTFLHADRTYLFEYDFVAETGSNTHEWCAEGISPEIDNLQNLPFELIPEWIANHRQGHEMHVPDVEALPSGHLRDLLESQGIRSLIALPLTHGERCMGFVGLDTVRSTHDYGEEETTLLLLFAQMLVNIRLRVEAQEQIRGLTEGLERKVIERTTQLETSVQQLQAVNRELESFTYSASHDLRTPLRGIEGFSSLLLDEHSDQLDDQGREYLKRIQRATIHMSTLVNDLLAYSRLQQLTDHIEPVDLAAAVQAVAAPFHDEIEARGGQLQVTMGDGVAVRANPQGLAIVLRNLIDNALKFTPAGQAPQIRIEAQTLNDRVLLSVSDNGIGFDMKYHDRIFGMFQRLHRQEQIPGTGIGLALVLKAVERMGGRIRAQSTTGQGARFEIDLPGA